MRRKEILKHGGGEGGNFCARLPEKEGCVCVRVCVGGGDEERNDRYQRGPVDRDRFLMLAAAAAVTTAAA